MFRTRPRRLLSTATLLSLAVQLVLVAAAAAAGGGADFPIR